MPGYKVITQAVRDEAPKWDGFAQDVAEIHRAIEDATLGVTAFFVGDPISLAVGAADATMHQVMYEKYRSYMAGLLEGAKTEFGQIADAVEKIAATYEREEEIGELRLKEIYGEMEK